MTLEIDMVGNGVGFTCNSPVLQGRSVKTVFSHILTAVKDVFLHQKTANPGRQEYSCSCIYWLPTGWLKKPHREQHKG